MRPVSYFYFTDLGSTIYNNTHSKWTNKKCSIWSFFSIISHIMNYLLVIGNRLETNKNTRRETSNKPQTQVTSWNTKIWQIAKPNNLLTLGYLTCTQLGLYSDLAFFKSASGSGKYILAKLLKLLLIFGMTIIAVGYNQNILLVFYF